jgi:hypothetical protein
MKNVVGDDVKLIKFNLYGKLNQMQLSNIIANRKELPAIFGNSSHLNIY